MKIAKLTSICILTAGLTLVAQMDEEFSASMKATGTALNNLKKMEKKTGPQAARNAERIGGVYETMIGFWRQRNDKDAVKWSEDGKAIALQLAAAAYAEDTEKADAALTALGSSCRSCHEAHREKIAEGKYRIK